MENTNELELYLKKIQDAEKWFNKQQITRYKLNEFIVKLLVDYADYYHKINSKQTEN